MTRIRFALTVLIFGLGGAGQGRAAPGTPTTNPPQVEVKHPWLEIPTALQLVGGLQWAEGPMWDADAGELVFTDLSADRIYRLVGTTNKTVVAQGTNVFANGIEAGTNGRWIVCEHKTQRVRRRNTNGTWSTIASTWQGKKFNSPNDNVTRADGTIFFTDPTYGSMPEFGGVTPQQSFQGVFRIEPSGDVHLVDDGLQQPNGIALSRNGDRLYVSDTASGAIMRYSVAANGSTGAGTQIATVPQPDGMTTDIAGYIYVAAQDGVRVLRADGSLFGTIPVDEQPSNVAFGGASRTLLYITARSSIYRAQLRIAGVPPPA